MTGEPALVLAWLVLAHLVADFTLQNDRLVRAKTSRGPAGFWGLAVHGLAHAIVLLPFVPAFGGPGVAVVLAVTGTHVVIDRVKVVLTWRAEAPPARPGRGRPDVPERDGAGLGARWTAAPAALFALDQLAHGLVLAAVYALFLSVAPVEPGFAAAVDGWLGAWDPAVVHAVVLTAVVLLALFLVNGRAAALFVAVLVGARVGGPPPGAAPGTPAGEPVAHARPVVPGGGDAGLVTADPEPVAAGAAPPSAASTPAPPSAVAALAPPARVGEAIGILERLLVVTFVLVRAEAAIGLVIAAKTLARFRQLDDRDFAEYYLLGTLASVAVAVLSGFMAAAALATLA